MKKPPPAAEAPPELKSDSEDMHGGENTDTDHEDDMEVPPTILKMEGKPASEKRKAVLLEESDGEEEDNADAGEEGHPGKGAMKKETSDRTCEMVQWWSDHHPPTKTFTSRKRWGGPHGGAAAIIWSTQQFNDWNQKESARIERVKAEGVIGLRQIKRWRMNTRSRGVSGTVLLTP